MTSAPFADDMQMSLIYDHFLTDDSFKLTLKTFKKLNPLKETNFLNFSAEQAKRRKYENLDSSFIFVPFGVETLGPWGPEARALFKELSKRVIESTGDPRAGSYLGQRISLAIQRGNATSILGTVPRSGGFEDILFSFK
ncbi:jg3340 [Pararge aegeria aegeria]|uniref:Jg3340 protein n=1 Tax=Pararge aegeria aegeria TaxID=348720 RepID=A0A8S4RSK9_9NEOP|nr:jg3340 [Pararge aegeria aegeria]